MVSISDDKLNRAARAVRARLERLLEFQVPEDSPYYMEVRKAQQLRERERARRLVGKMVAAPVTNEDELKAALKTGKVFHW